MGTNTEVFVFDYEAYIGILVPAFRDLFRQSQIVDWLQPFVDRYKFTPRLWDKGELARLGAVLNSDLSWVGRYDLKPTYSDDWQKHWTTSRVASEQSAAFNLRAPSPELAEQINRLFKIAVSVKTLGSGQFVGRSMTVSSYSDLLNELGVTENDRLVELLAALGKRGFIIGYQFGAGFEGVNGWLQPTETAELAERLRTLPLPQYEVSFAAMERCRRSDAGEYEYPGFTFEALSLSFVRTTASIAAGERRGLLWGNGLMPPEYYLEP